MLDERPWRHILELASTITGASSAFIIWKPFMPLHQEDAVKVIGHGPLCEQLCLPRDEKHLAQIFDRKNDALEQIDMPTPTKDGATYFRFLYGARLPANDAFQQGALCILNDKPLALHEVDQAAIDKLVIFCDIAAKSSVSMEILHDLRNPLSAIIGFADLIEVRGDLEKQDSIVKEYIGLIRECGQAALELTDNLLTLDFMRSHREAETEALKFGDFIDSCIRVAIPSANRGDIRVINEGGGGCMLRVSYRRSMRRILMNLLNNAILHNPPGTTVRIQMYVQQEELVLTVTDQLPPGSEDQPSVTNTEGYGMGLKIVRSLLLPMKGTFEFNSTPGKGTISTARISVQHPDRDTPSLTASK